MFELPECKTLADQMNRELVGMVIDCGCLGNSPHKFVWYNRSHEEFTRLTAGRVVGTSRARGRWIFVPLRPDYVLVLGECGGKILFHPPGRALPAKYHLRLLFTDGSALTVATRMWGAMELYEEGREEEREYIRDMRPTPVDDSFSPSYFSSLMDSLSEGEKRSVKGLLTQEQLIPGLGNSIAQDIMFRARLHPKHPIGDLDAAQRLALYTAIVDTVREVTAAGGRHDETDLYGNPGGYHRVMDSGSVGQPCPLCGTKIEKISYLGGSCYLCPHCQR